MNTIILFIIFIYSNCFIMTLNYYKAYLFLEFLVLSIMIIFLITILITNYPVKRIMNIIRKYYITRVINFQRFQRKRKKRIVFEPREVNLFLRKLEINKRNYVENSFKTEIYEKEAKQIKTQLDNKKKEKSFNKYKNDDKTK